MKISAISHGRAVLANLFFKTLINKSIELSRNFSVLSTLLVDER